MKWQRSGNREVLKLKSPYFSLLALGALFGAGNYLYFLFNSDSINILFHLVHIIIVALCILMMLKTTNITILHDQGILKINRKQIPLESITDIEQVVTHAGTRLRIEIKSKEGNIPLPAGKNYSEYSKELLQLLKSKIKIK